MERCEEKGEEHFSVLAVFGTGVDLVEVELGLEKVTVRGYVDRGKVLKKVRRSGKMAEFWPNPDQPLYFTTAKNYFYDEEAFRESYNYLRHGYNGPDNHGHAPAPTGETTVSVTCSTTTMSMRAASCS